MAPHKRRADADGRTSGAGEEGGAVAAEERPLPGAELASHKHPMPRWSDQCPGCRRAAWSTRHPSTAWLLLNCVDLSTRPFVYGDQLAHLYAHALFDRPRRFVHTVSSAK
jgi:hypothetical protein